MKKKPKLKDFYIAINESSKVGAAGEDQPASGYIGPGLQRVLGRSTKYGGNSDLWLSKGGYVQLDFPIADNPFAKDTQYRSRKEKIINPDLYIEPVATDNYVEDDKGEDFVQNPVTQKLMLDFYDLEETKLIAGIFDVKETMEFMSKLFKHYRVKPKLRWAKFTDMYAHYDFDRNILHISSKLNKNPKEFLHTILHVLPSVFRSAPAQLVL